jgi:hypothetical protein
MVRVPKPQILVDLLLTVKGVNLRVTNNQQQEAAVLKRKHLVILPKLNWTQRWSAFSFIQDILNHRMMSESNPSRVSSADP